MKSTRLSLPLATTLVLVLTCSALAGTTAGATPEERAAVLGDEFRVTDHLGIAPEFLGNVVWNGSAGEYLVVWGDDRSASTRGEDILGQRLAADGSRIGGNFRISGPNATSNEGSPDAAWNGVDEYLVVWYDMRNQATRGYDIYGQRLSATGARVGSEIRISGGGAVGDDLWPAVAWNAAAGQYLVVWEDHRAPSTRGPDVYGQRVSDDGVLVGGNLRIGRARGAVYEHHPAVVAGATANQYLVVWVDERRVSTRGADIYGQRLSGAGARLGGNFRISGANAISNEADPAAAWSHRSNEFLVVWADRRDFSTRGWDIYARRVAPDGTRIGGDFRVSPILAVTDDQQPDLAWNRVYNQFVVVWRSAYIFARAVSASGAPAGDAFRVSGPDLSTKADPALAWSTSANQGLAVWGDWRSHATRGPDIYGRQLSG